MRTRLLVTGLLLLAVAPSTARGATVIGHPEDVEDGEVWVVERGRETNRLAISITGGGLTVRENGPSALKASGTCRRRSRGLVECRDSSLGALHVDTGDRADSVAIRGRVGELAVHAGGGDDLVDLTRSTGDAFGGSGRDTLRAGSGSDALHGGSGADRLFGGGGRDQLWGQGLRDTDQETRVSGTDEDDLLDGGSGHDYASWGERRGGVTASLRSGRGGGRGERDRLRSIESLSGGRGDDRLTGDSRANELYGTGGRDVLTGGDGDDTLGAGFGSILYVSSGDGARDTLSCGRGRDRVDVPALDPLPRDCELLSSDDVGDFDGGYLEAHPIREPGNRFLFEAICSDVFSSCRRRVVLLAGGKELGRSETVEFAYSRRRIPVQLDGSLPGGVIEVRHEGEVTYDEGGTAPYLFRYRLRN